MPSASQAYFAEFDKALRATYGEANAADQRWFVVPKYTANRKPMNSAEVVDRCGQLVAVFEELRHAELVVALHNKAVAA